MSSHFIPVAALHANAEHLVERNRLRIEPTVIVDHGGRQDEYFIKCGSCVKNRKTMAYPRAEKNVDVEDSSIKAYAGSEPTTRVDDASPNAS